MTDSLSITISNCYRFPANWRIEFLSISKYSLNKVYMRSRGSISSLPSSSAADPGAGSSLVDYPIILAPPPSSCIFSAWYVMLIVDPVDPSVWWIWWFTSISFSLILAVYLEGRRRMESNRLVILEGGLPWGFRIQGGCDTGFPLRIARVCIIDLFLIAFLFLRLIIRVYPLIFSFCSLLLFI